MTTINEIFQEYAPAYIGSFGDFMPSEHRKVIDAMINCRTANCGTMIYQCEDCGKNHIVYRSCGNRHCPNCQHHKTHQWLIKQMKRQLSGHHFMITFTVPQKLRRFIRSHQRICYSALFKSSSETIKKLAANKKYVGGDLPGILGDYIPGEDNWHTIHTSTTSYQVAHSLKRMDNGIPPGWIFTSP